MSTEFDRYIGIDWSGAAQPRYRGVAVAECRPGRSAPRLLDPPRGKRWTRSAVLDWLLQQPAGERLLVGFDFAFGLPGDGRALPALWAEIEARCAQDEDLLGRAYAEQDPRFWHGGPRPANWNETPRATETACRKQERGQPQSPFHLIGAKQVGKGALAGMRLLHRLREQAGERYAVWPVDVAGPGDDARSICTEIYPRLFIRMAGLGNRKLRTREDLNDALNPLASIGLASGAFDDHEADALVSAAGLRRLAEDPGCWRAGAGQPEGWIFGVR